MSRFVGNLVSSQELSHVQGNIRDISRMPIAILLRYSRHNHISVANSFDLEFRYSLLKRY